MSDDPKDWVGQSLSGGRYRVDAKLGEGGMGFVYKVWDQNLDAEVVVKAPRKSMLDDPEFAGRFALEVRSLVRLSHPNIVKVSDVGEHDGLPFAVMQYLAGGTLDERLNYGRDGRPLPASPASVSAWLPGMAAALDFIHGKGYIHRDVKPANILFDSHGHPYLSDFGVAKVLSAVEADARHKPSGMTGMGIVLGTPEYMAPELIMGQSFDGRVDQYALAATAYEILCGRKPFTGETATAIVVRQTTQAPPPMTELPQSNGPAIARVVLKGLAKKPEDRFGSCSEFARTLVAALTNSKAGTARSVGSRLACPSCGLGFAATADLANFKGRASKCRACGAPFRIGDDGRGLVSIDSEPPMTRSATVKIPAQDRIERTTKLDAMPAPARLEQTIKLDAMPSPGRVQRTMKLEAIPSADDEPIDEEPPARTPLPWIIAAAGVAAVAMIFGMVLAFRPSSEPAVEVASAATPAPASVVPPKARPPVEKSPEPGPGPRPRPVPSAPTRPAPSPPKPLAVEVERSPASPPPPTPTPPEPEPEKPGTAPARSRIKPGQVIDNLTLAQIVANPGPHVGEVVFPSDLVLVGSQPVDHGLSVKSVEGDYRRLRKEGQDFEIVFQPGVAAHLHQELARNALVAGDYPAMLKMRIEKAPGADHYRGVVEWLEFLYYVDPRPLDHANMVNKALFVLTVTDEGAGLHHSPSHKDWEVRLRPTHIIPNVRNRYEQEGRPASYTAVALKATNPDRTSAPFFHDWIRSRIKAHIRH